MLLVCDLIWLPFAGGHSVVLLLHAADRASYKRVERVTTFDERERCQDFGLKKGAGGLLWSNCVCDCARMYLYVFLSTTGINILH